MKYRADIDGLRAVAVIAVVLFHAGIPHISGGFVGVDVFFVISGYLITGLILNDTTKGGFSVATFYERRARRILPALFVVLLAAAIAACALLMPDRTRAFGESMVATVFFCSNFVFWKQSSYFQEPEVKPLLHTWSLAVEEQFYILYPLFLIVVRRCFRRQYVVALLTVSVLSLGLCIWGATGDRPLTFYLAPARAWELLLGGLLAIPALRPLRSLLAANLLALLGLCLMVYSFIRLSGAFPFPAANALYPTLGAALVIYSGTSCSTLVSRGLSLKPIVFIGLISYSLYLWHWVVYVYLDYYLIRPQTGWEVASKIVFCIILAAVSWKYVEGPFRKQAGKSRFSRQWIFAAAVLGSATLAAAGAVLYLSHGLPSRFTQQTLSLYSGKDDIWKRHEECLAQFCAIGDSTAEPSFLLWGDSHAGAIAPAFEQIARAKHLLGYVAYNAACAPVLGLRRYDQEDVERCVRFNNSVLAFIKAKHIRNVFLHGRWAIYSEGDRYQHEDGVPVLLTLSRRAGENYPTLETLFASTVRELRRRELNVVIVASVPEVGIDVPTGLARQSVSGSRFDLRPSHADFMKRQARAFGLFSKAVKEGAVRVVYPHESLCDDMACSVLRNDHSLYVDNNHLSLRGTDYLVPVLSPYLDLPSAPPQ